jgi:hypothetical protein
MTFIKEIKKVQKKNAILICGGPSLEKRLNDIKNLSKSKNVIFIESRALTPGFVKSGIIPDYILAPYPEKLSQNGLHNYIYRSLLANVSIKYFIRKKYRFENNYIQKNFKKYFQTWKPEKGVHKKFKLKKNLYFKDSPIDLIKKYPKLKIITNKANFLAHFRNLHIKNRILNINFNQKKNKFSYAKYFKPELNNGSIKIFTSNFLNSAAICFLPIINKLGFKKLYLLGFDMNMLGNMEYSAKNLFKSFFHFFLFFILVKKSFNANFKINFPFYLRPNSEFKDFENIFFHDPIKTYNVVDRSLFVGKIKNLKKINYNSFLKAVQ